MNLLGFFLKGKPATWSGEQCVMLCAGARFMIMILPLRVIRHLWRGLGRVSAKATGSGLISHAVKVGWSLDVVPKSRPLIFRLFAQPIWRVICAAAILRSMPWPST
ncbi:hypothetical protein GFER_00920 [Geoalkalibacter ferrihydriticus DSM 17813]|uniref:Transposase DDE domain-containing protein n=1 Tax=Geoalkalibacter ferrihydriticus DSM 17813 TaxID=1121915 RepID=A0A0C2HX40_9BACT|nr:hypothetical protein GFER_00920 [Geoalkalibacter ferrihydriticus DSM 17813]